MSIPEVTPLEEALDWLNQLNDSTKLKGCGKMEQKDFDKLAAEIRAQVMCLPVMC